MTAAGPIRARCDGADRLIEADETLAALQVRLGGSFPGTLALPGLFALVRKARTAGVALSALLTLEDDRQPVSFRVMATPSDDGTTIEITEWKLAADAWKADENGAAEALLRQLAEAHVVLDAEQRVISGTVDASDLANFSKALRQGFGRYWTDLVNLRGNSHLQPLHWRLLDDAELDLPGSTRNWRARLLPLRSGGFELLLVAETVIGAGIAENAGPLKLPDFKGLLGRNLAPALRQPINRIVANAETIRTRLAGPLADQYANYAGDIAEAGRHLLGLVEDLSDLETVEDADFAPSLDQIDLADCARRAAGILGVRAQERSIIIVTPPADQRAPAIGEFRRILQILLNLIGNAIRYTPGHTTVTIAVGSEGQSSWLAVTDEGPGLNAEQSAKVFEKFERLGRSGDGGSGLGLYISRKLARAMGGELIATAAENGGARFILSLPSAQIDATTGAA
ncbi:MAG: histidine kinase [Novosphingobium sp. 32-60-15]|uniref:sensor histidine kinase n=1 Tax=unclassified Novosphingobium TaxID=2644732 RepID=UPI000BCBC838|nr:MULTISPECIES: HAMP domain-containing sensor histidine kinase [unclassified Novosphingobium]OYX63451.1 MAG: histidine kinase [Novosphingobium sp. 32-60-15]